MVFKNVFFSIPRWYIKWSKSSGHAFFTMAPLKQQPIVTSERDLHIKFEERQHKYYINGVPAKWSVTSYLSDLFPPFYRKKIATNCAKSLNVNLPLEARVLLIYATWEYASFVGSTVHDSIETAIKLFMQHRMPNEHMRRQFMGKLFEGYSASGEYFSKNNRHVNLWQSLMEKQINSANFIPTDDEMKVLQDYFSFKFTVEQFNQDVWKKISGFLKFWERYSHLNYICPEYMIFDEKLDLCGTIDMLCSTEEGNQHLYIIDWKTNKSMDHALEKYYCQLHTYAKILEDNYGVRVANMSIVHFSENEFYMYDDTKFRNCRCISHFNKLKAQGT